MHRNEKRPALLQVAFHQQKEKTLQAAPLFINIRAYFGYRYGSQSCPYSLRKATGEKSQKTEPSGIFCTHNGMLPLTGYAPFQLTDAPGNIAINSVSAQTLQLKLELTKLYPAMLLAL